MIPKIIHACWLGKAQMPEEYKRYIDGWKKLLPDYEIKLWTDENCAEYLDDSKFVKDCIEQKRYGFLSDYLRLAILYEFGGVYMDTDVELLKNIDTFLNCKTLMGFIFDSSMGTAFMGTEKNNPLMKEWIKILQDDYVVNGRFTVNNDWVTKYLLENCKDFRLNGKRQSLECGIEIYPKDYFERLQINKKSGGGYAEHHCAGSWKDGKTQLYKRILKKLLPRKWVSVLGHKRYIKSTPYYSVYLTHKREK